MLSFVKLTFLCLLFVNVHSAKLKVLDEANWEQMLQGEWMVEFYAPWCPACRALEPVWKDFATWSDDLGIKIGHVDVTTSPGLSGRFMVTALPTVYHVRDGIFRQYRGPRDKDEFISFVEERKWEKVEPIPSWKAPSSVQMSVVSGFFKLSMFLRNVHTQITEEHGIPTWGSYLLFGIATIVVGAILGLILVFLIDCFYPAKAPMKKKDEQPLEEHEPQEDEEEIVDDEEKLSEGNLETSDADVDHEDGSAEEEEESSQRSAPTSSPDVRKRRTRKAD